MADLFNLDTWAEANELTQDTIKLLGDKGFKTEKTISKLTPDIIKKEFKTLQLAQSFLLVDAVGSLNDPKKQDNDETKDTQDGGSDMDMNPTSVIERGLANGKQLSAQDVLTLFQNAAPATGEDGRLPQQSQQQQTQGKAEVFDPFQFNHSSRNPVKFRDIRDFISVTISESNTGPRDGMINIGDIQMSLKQAKPPLEKVRLSQYMEASLLILRAMALEDGLGVTQILQYVGYLTKIATFAQTYRWDSVLQYDFQYRKSQAELGFPWGADNAYLMQMYLKPHADKTSGSGQTQGSQASRAKPPVKTSFDPASGKPICQRFNGRLGCSFMRCNFSHVCMACYKPGHSEYSHRQGASHGGPPTGNANPPDSSNQPKNA